MLKNVMSEEQENYKKIFNKLGIDFVMLPHDEICCGSPVMNAGYKKDARKLAQDNLNLFKKHGIVKIITPCPGCYNMFKNEYPKVLPKWDIEVEHATQTILAELKKRNFKTGSFNEIVSYHDPCHLGRFSGIYNEPREIIKILNGEIKEMVHNRENALCCGAGGGMRANYSSIAKKIAKKRISEVSADAVAVLTPCGLCTANLKTADGRVMEFSNWVLRRLG
jgi:Fe-S oxidoreductase